MSRQASARLEWAIAAALFTFAVAVFWARGAGENAGATTAAFTLFTALTGAILALSVESFREHLRGMGWPSRVQVFAAPVAVTAAIAIYSAAVGLAVAPRAAAFGAYLLLPALMVAVDAGRSPSVARVLAVAVSLWLPLEFDLLPQLRLPPPEGLRAAPFVALAYGLYLFLVACSLEGIGYTFRLRRADFGVALLAAAAFAVVAVPIGVSTGFLAWHPRLELAPLVIAPVAIYLATAVPEEFLFRGLIQNTLERAIGGAALPVAAAVFGLAHLPDLRYVVLASLAGLAYGWVYARTRRITASAVTHAVVNWIWLVLLRA